MLSWRRRACTSSSWNATSWSGARSRGCSCRPGRRRRRVEDPAQVATALDGADVLCADTFDGDLVAEQVRAHPKLRGVLWTAEPLRRSLRYLVETQRDRPRARPRDFESPPRAWEVLMVARRLRRRRRPPPLARATSTGASRASSSTSARPRDRDAAVAADPGRSSARSACRKRDRRDVRRARPRADHERDVRRAGRRARAGRSTPPIARPTSCSRTHERPTRAARDRRHAARAAGPRSVRPARAPPRRRRARARPRRRRDGSARTAARGWG